MRTPSALSPTRGVQKGLELKLEPDEFAAWAEDTLVLWRSSRTKTACRCRHRKEARSLTHTSRTSAKQQAEQRRGRSEVGGSFNRKSRLLRQCDKQTREHLTVRCGERCGQTDLTT